MKRLAGTLGLAMVLTLGWAGGASAGTVSVLTATSACDGATGQQVVTWTFTNSHNDAATIVSAVIDAAPLTAGSTIDTTATFSPTTGILSLATAVATTRATGDAVGLYRLNLSYSTLSFPDGLIQGSLTLPGGCSVATTTAAPTTTAAATTTTAVGGSGSTLPHVGGNSSSTSLIAAMFVGIGGLLLAVRRRRSTVG